jgi:predicted transcriptional regulator
MSKAEELEVKTQQVKRAMTIRLSDELARRLARFELEEYQGKLGHRAGIIEEALEEWLRGRGY